MPDAIDRLKLVQTLNGLPMNQFEELVIALNPPAGILPPNIAAQGNRTPELLRWVEGPTGPGVPQLQVVLNLILPQSQTTPQSSASLVDPSLPTGELTNVPSLSLAQTLELDDLNQQLTLLRRSLTKNLPSH